MNNIERKPILRLVQNTVSLNNSCSMFSFSNGYTIEISNNAKSRCDPFLESEDLTDPHISQLDTTRSYNVEVCIFDNTGKNVTPLFDEKKRNVIPFVTPYQLSILMYVVGTTIVNKNLKDKIFPYKSKLTKKQK